MLIPQQKKGRGKEAEHEQRGEGNQDVEGQPVVLSRFRQFEPELSQRFMPDIDMDGEVCMHDHMSCMPLYAALEYATAVFIFSKSFISAN